MQQPVIRTKFKEAPIQTSSTFNKVIKRKDLLEKNGCPISSHTTVITRIVDKETRHGFTLGNTGAPLVQEMVKDLNLSAQKSKYEIITELKQMNDYHKAELKLQQTFFPDCTLKLLVRSSTKQEVSGYSVSWNKMVSPDNKDDEALRFNLLTKFERMIAQKFSVTSETKMCVSTCHFVHSEKKADPVVEQVTEHIKKITMPRARKY